VIRFQLPVSSAVRLTIYNLVGQLMRTLVDAQKPAGRHDLVWDGRNERGERLPSGVYLYRIEAGDFRAVRRLAMVK
jgi:flagellar hook assembly protein FlgD